MSNMRARLEKLERTTPQNLTYIWCDMGQTKEEAKAAYLARGSIIPPNSTVYYITWSGWRGHTETPYSIQGGKAAESLGS